MGAHAQVIETSEEDVYTAVAHFIAELQARRAARVCIARPCAIRRPTSDVGLPLTDAGWRARLCSRL